MRKLYVNLYILSKLAKKELNSNNQLSLSKKLFSWRKGFFSNSYILYGLNKINYKLFLSDYQENVKAIRLNDKHSAELDNKKLFSSLVTPYFKAPVIIAYIENGIIKLNSSAAKLEEFISLLKTHHKDVIIKPLKGAGGYGIYRLTYENDMFKLNRKIINESELSLFFNQLVDCIVSPFLTQAEYSSNIYAETVNTIRVLTMVNPVDNKVFIAAAAHRFGTNKSFPVDNCNSGGLTSEIDLNSGILGLAVSTHINNGEKQEFTHHPDTGKLIKGVIIPEWDKIKESILKLAGSLSHLIYVGWDIVHTGDDIIILEGNNGPDIKLHQVHAPLLIKENVRSFYKYHKVI